MESDAIVDLVSNASHALGCYIRSIVMDDDTNVHDNLEEDLGDLNAGRLEKCLSRITLYVDPMHRKRTYHNHLFELKEGMATKEETSKITGESFCLFPATHQRTHPC